MSTVPSDSILRRHHEQMQRAAQAQDAPAPAPPQEQAAPAASRPATPRPAARPAAATPVPTASGEGGGFFAWLKKLFGG